MAIITLTETKAILGLTDPCQASGLLVVGQKYTVKVKGATGNFSNVGTASIEVGVAFYATGTTPTAWGGTILYVNNETVENKITALIPEVEADFLLIRNRPFQLLVGDTTNGSATVSNVTYFDSSQTRSTALTRAQQLEQNWNDIYELLPGQTISGNGVQASLLSIADTTETLTLSSNASATVSGNVLTAYPIGSKLVAADMIQYRMKRRGGGEKSETIGSYSYTAGDVSQGYPRSITSRIDSYVGAA